MRKLTVLLAATFLSASAATAADIIYDEPAPAPQPIPERFAYDWTGFYVGAHGGLGTGDFDYRGGFVGDPDYISANLSAGGGFLGGQVGYDWQFDSWVFGAVADISKSWIDADLSVTDGFDTAGVNTELDYLGTIRARAGFAFDRALIYAHGGWAYGRTEQTVYVNDFDILSNSQSRNGWVIGAGAEYALTDNISLGTEYAYTNFGRKNLFTGDVGLGDDVYIDERFDMHTVKASINFRF